MKWFTEKRSRVEPKPKLNHVYDRYRVETKMGIPLDLPEYGKHG
jgi:hypothetical protein